MGDDSGDEQIISLQDYIDETKGLEDTAQEVLGGVDDSVCTYPLGYHKRQPLYSCLTCCPAPGPASAGVCLACALACHSDHNLEELYTKRTFRCDCGNSKFPGFRCSLEPNKDELNTENRYNHNFAGLYCTCERPYETESNGEDGGGSMTQCVFCEDWFHSEHIGLPDEPLWFESVELVCAACRGKHPFLEAYVEGHAREMEADGGAADTEERGRKRRSQNYEAETKRRKTDVGCVGGAGGSECVWVKFQRGKGSEAAPVSGSSSASGGSVVLDDSWRDSLCRCVDCIAMYSNQSVSFLLDKEDTMSHYTAAATANAPDNASKCGEAFMEFMFKTGPFQQMELIHGYNEFKEELLVYLAEFAEKGVVVTIEHVREFFDRMNEKRRVNRNNMAN